MRFIMILPLYIVCIYVLIHWLSQTQVLQTPNRQPANRQTVIVLTNLLDAPYFNMELQKFWRENASINPGNLQRNPGTASTRSIEQDVKHCMMKNCLVKWCVLKRYAQEYNVKMYKCIKCEQWMCNMCCKTDAAFEFYKMTCPGVVRNQIEKQRKSGRNRKAKRVLDK